MASLPAVTHTVLPHALAGLPTAAAVAALCVAVAVEIVVIPGMLLPGGTVTLIAGALIGSGRPALAVAIPLVLSVIAGDHFAYFCGAALVDWWHRRRPVRAQAAAGQDRAGGDHEPAAARGRTATWLAAAMPSVAGATRMPYPAFAVRILILRMPWLAAALSIGALAAQGLGDIGHIAGIGGLIASALVLAGLLVARHRPGRLRVPSGRSRNSC